MPRPRAPAAEPRTCGRPAPPSPSTRSRPPRPLTPPSPRPSRRPPRRRLVGVLGARVALRRVARRRAPGHPTGLDGTGLARHRSVGRRPRPEPGGRRRSRRSGRRQGCRPRRDRGRTNPQPVDLGPLGSSRRLRLGEHGRRPGQPLCGGRDARRRSRSGGEVVAVPRHGQKLTGTSETSAGWSTRGPTPSFSLTFFSISSARSGLSLRKVRAFSLPCPSWSPS